MVLVVLVVGSAAKHLDVSGNLFYGISEGSYINFAQLDQ